jgi:hypothetical protein
VKLATLKEAVVRNVEPGSIVSTDELMSYALLERSGYKHGVVTHSAKEWSFTTIATTRRTTRTRLRASGGCLMKNAMFDLLIGSV